MRRKYPWEEWFDQPRTVLAHGVDYHITQSAMVQAIRNNASMRRVRVRITDTGTGVIIRVIDQEGDDAVPCSGEATVVG